MNQLPSDYSTKLPNSLATPQKPSTQLTSTEPPDDGERLPASIGRYEVRRLLGKGAFGRVYLGHDLQMDRPVAIKVPNPERIRWPESVGTYQSEAKTLARLDHPNIVPVYDVSSADDQSFYIVSRYIEGKDLAALLRNGRLSFARSADLVATVAEALHYAHKQGIVHRDIKPANILLNTADQPVLVDFGLALRGEDVERSVGILGTPAYMSPEQARGEGHRVDGRSDIFSLGAVFYELLTGRRPFRGETQEELLEQVTTHEPWPPRQIVDAIPMELERICLKMLAKRVSERYLTAKDLADELRLFLVDLTLEPGPSTSPIVTGDDSGSSTTAGSAGSTKTEPSTLPATHPGAPSQGTPFCVVPKGVRAFDAHDSSFFLELLPGPRDRNGLPEAIRFWKSRIEQPCDDVSFAVGLIYGPSGCGKSSLVKAGLLPRLSGEVISVYVEATSQDTEMQLLNGLRRRCPALDDRLSLSESVAALRRGQFLPNGKKVLIVLDQFEQWLHANRDAENGDLVKALRQCDGGRVHCLVLVRDDFWLAMSRFLREIEVRIVEGFNIALVDLFDLEHARKVLEAFGRAYGKLPDRRDDASQEQRSFVKQSVDGLAEGGKVVSVRLALFADLIKGKPWTSATFKEVGGTSGVAATFLEERIGSRTASPTHRFHEKAARAVLKALLPEPDSDIRGQMKSREALLEASGYANLPNHFDELLRLLDGELRLITPTDPDERAAAAPGTVRTGTKYYQLTHDYLVHPIRDWLTRKQHETKRGRAELRLTERTAIWGVKPEDRQLPSWWEYLVIMSLTSPRKWTAPQQRMMRRAAKVHAIRGLLVLAVVTLAAWGCREWYGHAKTREFTSAIAVAAPESVLSLVQQLTPYRRWANSMLEQRLASETDSTTRLRLGLALVPVREDLVNELTAQLVQASEPEWFAAIHETLMGYRSQVAEQCWQVLHDSQADSSQRFRAAVALAGYAPDDPRWSEADAQFTAAELLRTDPERQSRWRSLLRPISHRLAPTVEQAFHSPATSEIEKYGAFRYLTEVCAADAACLARVCATANAGQFAVLYPLLESAHRPTVLDTLAAIVREEPEESLDDPSRITLGRRRAAAALALIRLREPDLFSPMLRFHGDPEALTQFAARVRSWSVTPEMLLECITRTDARRQTLQGEARQIEDRALYGLLLALGEYSLTDLPDEQAQKTLVTQLTEWYAQDPSSGIHGATGWLLRHFGQDEIARKVDETPVDYSPAREWFVIKIVARTVWGTMPLDAPKTLYFTFVVFQPGDYEVGTPRHQSEKGYGESQYKFTIPQPIAVLDREVTREEFELTGWRFEGIESHSPSPQHAMGGPMWYQSVAFCHWLTRQRDDLTEEDQAYEDPEKLKMAGFEPDKVGWNFPKDWPLHPERRGFRLLWEEEWEIACRGGTSTAYSFGSDVVELPRYGWTTVSSGWIHHVPKLLRPNPRGLFDVHGNVAEWVHDWAIHKDGGGKRSVFDAETSGIYRIVRSGSCFASADNMRSASKTIRPPASGLHHTGFRIAMTLPPSDAAKPAAE